MRLTAFSKLYKMCTLLQHRCDLEIFAKNRFEKSAIFVKMQQKFCRAWKCCQTHIFLQNFVLIQPRTSPPKICKFLFKKLPNLLILPTLTGRDARRAPPPPAGGGPWGRSRSPWCRSCPTRSARRVIANFGKFSAKCRSFSAVSAPIFASKYAFYSIFQHLQDYNII